MATGEFARPRSASARACCEVNVMTDEYISEAAGLAGASERGHPLAPAAHRRFADGAQYAVDCGEHACGRARCGSAGVRPVRLHRRALEGTSGGKLAIVPRG